MGTLAWELWLGNFGLGTLAQELWLGNLGLGSCTWDLSLRLFRLGSSAKGDWARKARGKSGGTLGEPACTVVFPVSSTFE